MCDDEINISSSDILMILFYWNDEILSTEFYLIPYLSVILLINV